MPAAAQFLAHLATSLEAGTLVKLTLGAPLPAAGDLRNVYGRVIDLKSGRHLSLVFRQRRGESTSNLPFAAGLARVGELLAGTFARAWLFTTGGDWEWQAQAGGGALKSSRPRCTAVPAPVHDHEKALPVPAGAPFLRALGVANAEGAARPGMVGKLRQIQRFTELLGHLLDDSALHEKTALRVCDIGSGKGYLTFAAHEFLRGRGLAAEVRGIEARPDLAEFTERVARELGADGLSFRQGTAEEAAAVPMDVLIALHACDTATDDALALGVRAGAALLVTAPCCHREVRAQMHAPPLLQAIVRHGILEERQAEIVTDAVRALVLEIHGYRASVFEFISPEHTGKNLMLAAHRRAAPVDVPPLRRRLREMLDFFGLREQRLARTLGEL